MQSTVPTRVTVSTFYHFAPIADPLALKQPMLDRMRELGVRGTITFATEGVNATIAGPETGVAQIVADIRALPGFSGLVQRLSESLHSYPFGRSKVKVKKELISLGAKADPSVCVGEYVAPADWNALITAPDVITIDTRNAYEFEIGHFKGAINPATRTFKQMVAYTEHELSPRKNTRVAMYCTGGIRCEKYSSYLVSLGFTHVYHLQGGILAYLEAIPPEESLWEGECFVFDERLALGHGLQELAA